MTAPGTSAPVVIVGASAAGLATAERLRHEGHDGALTLVGDETHLPYDRPPLSKKVLTGEWGPERTMLRPAEAIDRLGATWRLGCRAVGVDPVARTVATSTGEPLPYDHLVVATGVRPRLLPGWSAVGIHTLRTIDDALALRAALRPRSTVVVVGAGFLGTEVAAAACELGVEVHLVDPMLLPLSHVFGEAVGRRVAALHAAHGVHLHLGVGLAAFDVVDGRVRGATLADGTSLAAETVLVGIGSVPNVEWLEGSGLDLANGVLCDEHGLAAPGIHAVGDVARWYRPVLARHDRTEHRMNVTEQAGVVARSILGLTVETPRVPPYFWTDQFDARIQVYGYPSAAAEVRVVAGDVASDAFAIVYDVAGRSLGALTWNLPGEARRLRQVLGESFTDGEPLALAPTR